MFLGKLDVYEATSGQWVTMGLDLGEEVKAGSTCCGSQRLLALETSWLGLRTSP